MKLSHSRASFLSPSRLKTEEGWREPTESQRGMSIKDNNGEKRERKKKKRAWEEVKGWGIREEEAMEVEM